MVVSNVSVLGGGKSSQSISQLSSDLPTPGTVGDTDKLPSYMGKKTVIEDYYNKQL